MQSDTLRPRDFAELAKNRNYSQDFFFLVFNSAPLNQVSFSLSLVKGGNINFVPAAGQAPSVVNQTQVQAAVSLRPFNALSIDNSYLLDRNISGLNHQSVFNSHILRSKWNYQFNKALSLRFIGQYNAVLPNALKTSLEKTKNFNADFLITYLLHPGTALYLGYNTNLQNLNRGLCARLSGSRQCDPGGNGLLRSNRSFINDGRQVFVKISYLFRL